MLEIDDTEDYGSDFTDAGYWPLQNGLDGTRDESGRKTFLRGKRMKAERFTKKLEINLPAEWNAKLEAEAERSVTTKTELARQAIIAMLRKREAAVNSSIS